ncbi:MAG: CBS domain-containing protein [Magnetococcales bacterium]|nr:CBS domain-containing protein [Magnetococcales bacterium]
MRQEFTGIHHTAFATQDIKSTVRFWRDLLGARLVYAYGRPGYRQYFFQISGKNRISFFAWDNVQPVPLRRHGEPVEGPFIFDHISIGVADLEVLWDLMARLDAAGFPCSDVVDHGCFYSIYSYDPNGIPIEFSTDVPNQDLYWNPVMKDAANDSEFLTRPNPFPGIWPNPEPIEEDDRITVPGEGVENFQNIERKEPNTDCKSKHLKVKQIMTTDVHTVRSGDSVQNVAKALCKKRISGMPVLDDNDQLVGIISEKDILEAIYPGYAELRKHPDMDQDFCAIEENYADVLQMTVDQLMVKTIYTVGPHDSAIKAAMQMDIHKIQRLPVVDEQVRLLGFVSRGDIHRAIFKQHLTL